MLPWPVLARSWRRKWKRLHRGEFFAGPELTFLNDEIDVLLRHLTVSFPHGAWRGVGGLHSSAYRPIVVSPFTFIHSSHDCAASSMRVVMGSTRSHSNRGLLQAERHVDAPEANLFLTG